MKTLVLLAAAVSLASCTSSGTREYDNNDLVLATAYTAKEVCSCMFVMGQTEDYCRAWTKASPDVAKFKVDTEAKEVRSVAAIQWSGKAKFVNEREGCVIE